MCQRIRCEQCHKPTFAGCGKHVEQVLRGIAEADRCSCKRSSAPNPQAARIVTASKQTPFVASSGAR